MGVSQRKINEMYERALAALDAVFADLPAASGGKIAADGLRNTFAGIREKGKAQRGFTGSAKVGSGERSVARFNIRDIGGGCRREKISLCRSLRFFRRIGHLYW